MIRVYASDLTFDVSPAEKIQARKATVFFNHAIKLLDVAKDHLDVMKTPFKDSPNMTPEDVMKARSGVRRFRDKAVENFNEFKRAAFQCVRSMQPFSTDTQTTKLIKSFIGSIDDLEFQVNKFVELFSDLEDQNFTTNVVEAIEKIQAKCEEVEEIVEDRIKKHINQNILSATWVDDVGEELDLKIEKETPLLMQLYNDRQDQLNDAIKERSGQQ